MESIFYRDIEQNIMMIQKALPVGKSFDIITREIYIGGTKAYFISINGMYNNEVMQLILSDLQREAVGNDENKSSDNSFGIEDLQAYLKNRVSFGQVLLTKSLEEVVKNVVSGPSAIIVDGFREAVVLDLRKYPGRGISEPENEKVLKGAKDGFVETMLFNANMIRRRIRNPRLTFEMMSVGEDSKTDVALAYIGGIAKNELVDTIRTKIADIKADSLTLGSKSLEELLVKKRLWNPMPSFRVTERPDVACSYLFEGYVIIIVDNTPSVIVLPGNVFQFSQSPEDYYRNPITGNLFRMLRFASILISVYLLPVYMLLNAYMPDIMEKINLLSGNAGREPFESVVRLICYVLFAEFGLDMLEYSASHIPENLVTPVSIVGGVVIGEMAVNMKWFSEEVLFYAAITLLTTFVISNSEFSDALRIFRILLILMTGFFGIWGLVFGTALIILSVVTTPTIGSKSYIWPLVPLDIQSLYALIFRKTMSNSQPDIRKGNKTP